MTSIIKVDTIQTAAGGTPTASSLGIGGTGKIGQVVFATSSTTQTSTSTSYVDTGLNASITPSSTSSKILVLISINGFIIGSNASSMDIDIARGGTVVLEYQRALYKASSATETQLFFQCLDSPNTTSSINYRTRMRRGSGGETVLTDYSDANGDSISTITLMEVLA